MNKLPFIWQSTSFVKFIPYLILFAAIFSFPNTTVFAGNIGQAAFEKENSGHAKSSGGIDQDNVAQVLTKDALKWVFTPPLQGIPIPFNLIPDGSGGLLYNPVAAMTAVATKNGNKIYITDWAGGLTALIANQTDGVDATTGKPAPKVLWTVDVKDYSVINDASRPPQIINHPDGGVEVIDQSNARIDKSRSTAVLNGKDLFIGNNFPLAFLTVGFLPASEQSKALREKLDGAVVLSIDRHTGDLNWITRVDEHPVSIITSNPVVHKDKVYIGLSTNESGVTLLDLGSVAGQQIFGI